VSWDQDSGIKQRSSDTFPLGYADAIGKSNDAPLETPMQKFSKPISAYEGSSYQHHCQSKSACRLDGSQSSVRCACLISVKQVHNIPLDIGAPIQSASIGEPYLMVISEQGAMMLLQLKVSDDGDARLTVLKQPNEMARFTYMSITPIITQLLINSRGTSVL